MKLNKTQYSQYLGILILYLKLFFTEPILVIQSVNITITHILLLILLVRLIFKLTFLNINVFGENKSAKFFWGFVLVSSLSSFFLSLEIATGVLTVNFQLFLIYLIFIDFKNITIDVVGLQNVINKLVNFAIINAFLVMYTYFFGKIGLSGEVTENANAITRAFGLMGDQVAWFLTFFGVFSLYNGKKYHYIIFATAILMGASLGATIVLLISTLIYFLDEKVFKLSFYTKTGFLFLIFILLLKSNFLAYDKIGILQRINEGDFSSTNSQTTGHRYNAIINAIDRIEEKPLWGYQNYSLTMFNKYNNLLSDSQKGDLTYLTTPNNQILAIICDYGFIGLLFFIVFIYSLIKIVRKKGKSIPPKLYAFKQSAFIWLVVFIVFNQSATWFLPGSFLWILICIIIGISYKINRLYGIK
jgi:hypothetical protein